MNEKTLTGTGEVDTPDVLATAPLVVPADTPDKHQGQITGIEMEVFDSGVTAIKVDVVSLNVEGVVDFARIFLPRNFVEDISVDPTTLPSEQGNNQRMSYTIDISNDDGTGTLETLRAIALSEGRTLTDNTPPTTIEEYVALHAELLVGTQVVFTRAPDRTQDAPFNKRNRVNGFHNPADVVGNPKRLKRYAPMWE